MKRYLLFAGATYYPGGGWDDFVGHFDDVKEARKKGDEVLKEIGNDWFQIVDTTTMKVV
jgi:hypothetical protein